MPCQTAMHAPPEPTEVSLWINRFVGLIPAGGVVLDLACGDGRHVRFLLAQGHRVLAVDRYTDGLADLAGNPALEVLTTDLEGGRPWPLADQRFAGVIVTNYLHRPLLPAIVGAVAPGGSLLYETFAVGNERFGRPSNPDFLLRPGELLAAVAGQLQVVAYENLEVVEPRPAVVQRIAAFRPDRYIADKHLE
jgi:SAM-dependent methyltransferase